MKSHPLSIACFRSLHNLIFRNKKEACQKFKELMERPLITS